MSEEPQMDDVRSTLQGVLERARNDEAYLAALREDPVSVLEAAGLPEGFAMHVASDELGLADVSGFRAYERGCPRYTIFCDTISCLITMCADVPNTNVTLA